MNWIIASILMFLSSVAMYLFIRKSVLIKTSQQLNNLACFVIPFFLFVAMSYSTGTSLALTPFVFVIILTQAIFCSYLGGVFSLKGIELAPNPGYSLIISKSYVVFTTIASVFLFNAPLTSKSLIAISLIIGFSTLIVINNNKNKTATNPAWLYYTFGAFFCWGFLALSSKFLLNLGVPVLTRLVYLMGFVSILILGELRMKRIPLLSLEKAQVSILLLIGLFSASFNYFMQVAFNLAPNVGFVNTTNAASISLLTLLSAYFFKDDLTIKKVIGIAGVTAGLIVLFI